MRSRLNKRTIDELRAKTAGDLVVWDSELRGFGVRIKRSGRTSFMIQYRNAYGRSRRKTLGHYPPLTPHEARLLAHADLASVSRGIDPVEAARQARGIPTVRALADRYLGDYVEVHSKPKTLVEAKRALDGHVVPALGHLAIVDVKSADLARLHQRMRKTPVLANRVIKVASSMFSFAMRAGLLPDEADNPAAGIPKYKERKRDRHLSLAEYESLGKAIDRLVEAGDVSANAGAAIRFLALTGFRVSEALALRWSDLSVQEGRGRLRDTKTGPRQVVLNSAACRLLACHAENAAGSEWVFPGRVAGKPLVNISKPWGLIREAAGLTDVRLHDLRHSFASVGVASQLGLPVVGALLGHRHPVTTARYAHLADDPLRQATNRIGGTIGAALRGAPNAEVVPLPEPR